MLWLFVLPAYFPSVSGYRFFLPFILFFPFFGWGRRGRGGSIRTPEPRETERKDDQRDYTFDNMMEDTSKQSMSNRNALLFILGTVMIIIAIVLALTKII